MSKRGPSLIIVITGDGKGKTTSAFGQALRAAGGGTRVAIVQFIKGAWRTGEVDALARTGLPITVERSGLGFTIERLRDPRIPMSAHEEAARAGLDIAREHLRSGNAGLVILDEVFGAITAGLISEADVLEAVRNRAPDVHVILTGRGASQQVMDAADLVSEVRAMKHPMDSGIAAQRGIEF
jgi:cob(I)alamin adenosyltransferase